jgi:hypothetical protein
MIKAFSINGTLGEINVQNITYGDDSSFGAHSTSSTSIYVKFVVVLPSKPPVISSAHPRDIPHAT